METRRHSWIDSIGWMFFWSIYSVIASIGIYILFQFLKGFFIFFFGRKYKQAG